MGDIAQRSTDLPDEIDGTTVVRTGDGTRFTADLVGLDSVRLDSPTETLVVRAAGLLDLLKEGHYYLPAGGQFQAALRRLDDTDAEDLKRSRSINGP